MQDGQTQAAALQFAMEKIAQLERQVGELQNQKLQAALCEKVQGFVPPDLHIKSLLTAEDRKSKLANYRKFESFPTAKVDQNGLVGKIFSGQGQLKQAVTELSKHQRNALDIARIAADTWDSCLEGEPSNEMFERALKALRDIMELSFDNAQFMAKKQLEHVFEAAQAKGAYALLHFDTSEGSDIDLCSDEILQPAYVKAIESFRKISKSVEPHKKQSTKNGQRGGFGVRENGYGKYRGGGYSYRGSGQQYNYRGRGGGYPRQQGNGRGGGQGGDRQP